MGRIKYIKDIRNLFKRNVIVDINSLKKFIQKKKKDERYVHQIIHNMIKNEEIIIQDGKIIYIINEQKLAEFANV